MKKIKGSNGKEIYVILEDTGRLVLDAKTDVISIEKSELSRLLNVISEGKYFQYSFNNLKTVAQWGIDFGAANADTIKYNTIEEMIMDRLDYLNI